MSAEESREISEQSVSVVAAIKPALPGSSLRTSQQPSSEPTRRKSSGPVPRKPAPRSAGDRACFTPGCNQPLLKAKGIYCSEACYVRGCQASGTEPRTCNQPGCSNVSVPGEQGGARCAKCYAAHKLGYRQAAGKLGRICGLEACGQIVYGEKPKYGAYCSLECGRASGQGRACSQCGMFDVFKGSQSGRLCLECYNAAQTEHKRPLRKEEGEGGGEGGGTGKRRKTAVP